jgi:hypothetical protein
MNEMLSLGNTLTSGGGSVALDTRVAVGAGVFAVSSADAASAVTQSPDVTSAGQKLPAYNAFEFSYRSDFGKVILLQQNVETGQEVTQVPTEYHLQQYAANQRQQRVQQLQKLYGAPGEGQADSGKTAVVTVASATPAKSGAPATGQATPTPAPAAAPAVAPSVAAAASTAHVDIKV